MEMRYAARGFGRAMLGPALVLLLAASPAAHALDLLGAYVGAGIGQARIDTGSLSVDTLIGSESVSSFTQNHSAYKLMLGVRPISPIGAEVDYLNFGHPSTAYSQSGVVGSADVNLSGAAAFGVVYLLPVPLLDLYVKAGVAHLQASWNVSATAPGIGTCTTNNPTCASFSGHGSATNTSWAGGAGVQVKIGPWAVRAEYERFNVLGGNPGLTTLGATWTFF
jgi:opacity protein-like surface antigen